jgi:hypothetical protein
MININVRQDSVSNSIGFVMVNGIVQMRPMKKLFYSLRNGRLTMLVSQIYLRHLKNVENDILMHMGGAPASNELAIASPKKNLGKQ